MERFLDELKVGERGIIESISDEWAAIKLIEMGCLPGEEVLVKLAAPFRDPIAIEVCGNLISLRKSEAKCIKIKLLEK